ncbi:multicopper oxidase domain-containing protein [Microbacterium xylanilyticum]
MPALGPERPDPPDRPRGEAPNRPADRVPDRPADRAPNRGFSALRDIPTVLWLLLVVAAALVHRSLPVAGWLMLHLLLLGAVTHAILVWSQYFSFALLRIAPRVGDRRTQAWRLAFGNGGALLVLAGVVLGIWPVTLAGAALLVAAATWHGVSLWLRMRRSLPGRFGRTIRYYIAAAAMLVVGVGLGAWLARDHADHDLVLSHALLHVFGWIGLTVAGTVVTLWPTMLRTRADPRSAAGAVRALPVLAGGVAVAAAGAAAGLAPAVALGLLAYAAGLAIIAVSLWRAARQAVPHSFAALSVGAGLLWWIGCLAALAVAAITSSIPAVAQSAGSPRDGIRIRCAVGARCCVVGARRRAEHARTRAEHARRGRALPRRGVRRPGADRRAQLSGARGARRRAGPGAGRHRGVRPPRPAARRRRERRAAGVRAAGLQRHAGSPPRCSTSLPRPRSCRSWCSPCAPSGRAKARPVPADASRRGPIVPEGAQPPGRRAGQAVAGLLTVVAVVAGAAALDPLSLGWSAPAPVVAADAPVKVVTVHAANMRFTPNRIEVPSGTHLKIALTNTDASQVHDLVLANGTGGTRLAPGQSETIDAGVITAQLDGWCSIIGHRQAGMTLTIVATGSGSSPAPDASPSGAMPGMPGMAGSGSGAIDLNAEPGSGFRPYDAELKPLAPATGPVTRRVTLTVANRVVEVAPGVTQTLWEYDGSAPGPVLHGRVGDTFVVTLVNHGDMGHSIDFHAGAVAPDQPMRTIPPGQSLTYTFTATRSGIWMYHCSTMPMSAHIASGMYGAVVIEPADLAPVARSYVLVQGEYYLGSHDGGQVDTGKVAAGTPDLVVFNGYANQYDHTPLTAAVGERVRVWVLDAGIERASSFHVVGGQFDTVWSEGRYLLDHATGTGSQALGLNPAQGGFVELAFPEAGHYPFVSHYMVDAERGAHGVFDVKAPPRPGS